MAALSASKSGRIRLWRFHCGDGPLASMETEGSLLVLVANTVDSVVVTADSSRPGL